MTKDYFMQKCDSCEQEFFTDGSGPKSCYQCRRNRGEPEWPDAHDPLVCGIDGVSFCKHCKNVSVK